MLPNIDEAEMAVTSNDPCIVLYSRSGAKMVRNLGKQKWGFEITWPQYLQDKSLALEVALDAMYGQSLSAEIIHPSRGYHTSAEGDWTVQTAVNQGEQSVDVVGQGDLTVGHYIKFENHTKVYRVMSYSNSAVTLYPVLRAAVASGESIIVQAVPILVSRTEDEITSQHAGPLTSLSATFEELL